MATSIERRSYESQAPITWLKERDTPACRRIGMSWPRFETTGSQAKKSSVWEAKAQRFAADKTRVEDEAEICTVKDCGVEHLPTGSTEVHRPRPLASAL